MTPSNILSKYYGYSTFRPGQIEIINSIIKGINVVAILPTGAGKSLCYQIPALLSDALSIVVSPLIALMKDQVDAINKNETVAAYINSSLDYIELEKVLNKIELNEIKILYIAPERLENVAFAERIKSFNPKYLFIDEAHCISEWGHNFRPSYRRIINFAEFIGIKNISAFTATATLDVRKDIVKQLKLSDPKVFVQGFERENLSLEILHTKNKKEKVLSLVNNLDGSAIIYTSTRKNAEELAEYLLLNKIDTHYYHAGLDNSMRQVIQDDFISDRIKVIVATNAFGMGIDKSDIRLIVHYNLPGSIENYYQEIGRAGRDGNEADVVMFYTGRDKNLQQFLISISFPDRSTIEKVYNGISDYNKISLGLKPTTPIKINNDLIQFFNKQKINPSQINSALNILRDSGYIEYKNGTNSKHSIKSLLDNTQLESYIRSVANSSLKQLLVCLLKEYGGKIFINNTFININKISKAIEVDQASVITDLELLNTLGIINYSGPSISQEIKYTHERIKATHLKIEVSQINKLKAHAENKLETLVELVFTDDCRFKFILEYFGEETGNYKCGKCDNCSPKASLSKVTNDFIGNFLIKTLDESLTGMDLRYLVRTVAGNSDSPKAKQYSTFGSCSHYTINEIKTAIENLTRKKTIKNIRGRLILIENENDFLDDIPEQVVDTNYESDLKLFGLLKNVRSEVAKKFNQPANMICNDEVLRNVAIKKPTSQNEIITVEKFTQRMFNKIGEELLATINKHISEKSGSSELPENLLSTSNLLNKGYSLEDISKLTRLPEAVISMQIESIIEFDQNTDITKLVSVNEKKIIMQKYKDGIRDIKSLKAELPNDFSYAKIRIVLAAIRSKF